MKIFDTFMFRDELDMLECRLTELGQYPQVYRHVLVEATVDHQGHPKPLYFAENRERFAPWADRIVHLVAEGMPDTDYPWQREQAQRENVHRGLAGAAPGDYVIVADVDEIPSAAAMAAVDGLGGAVAVFEMRCCVFAVDWLWPEPMQTSVVAPVAKLWSMADARMRGRVEQVIHGAGFHLTWLGGADAVRAKMAAHCHTECNAGIAEVLGDRVYRDGVNPFQRWSRAPLVPADVDGTWPQYVRERRCPESWFRPRDHA